MLLDASFTGSEDYISSASQVIFQEDEIVKEVQVTIIQDDVAEGLEEFSATLLPLTGSAGVSIGGDGVATATIIDDDSESVGLNLCVYYWCCY